VLPVSSPNAIAEPRACDCVVTVTATLGTVSSSALRTSIRSFVLSAMR
jgi:hypothetical protein